MMMFFHHMTNICLEKVWTFLLLGVCYEILPLKMNLDLGIIYSIQKSFK